MNGPQPGSNPPLQKSLPSFCYTSPDFFAQEKEKIFFREWFCAGREAQIAHPGDYLVLDVVGESILVVRTKEGKLAAHYNVCRHRGAQLCNPPTQESPDNAVELKGGVLGTTGIRCPYHQWTYALDGRLLNAPYFGEGEGWVKESFSLHPVGVDTWGGFFFLNLTPPPTGEPAITLRQQLGDAVIRVQRYPLGDLHVGATIVYDVHANWKAIVENYNECYHCGPIHPELCEVVPAFRQQGGAQLDWDRGIAHRDGAHTYTFSGTTTRGTFPGLDEDEKVRHKGELLYPNFMLSLSSDHAAAFTLWPQSPSFTRIVCDFLFHPEEISKPNFSPNDAVDFWDLVNRQDWEVCKRVQQGMHSRVHKFGYYAPMEDLSADIRRYVAERLGPIKY